MTSTLHHLALTAADLTKTGEFYDEVLGAVGYTRSHTGETFCMWGGQHPEILLYAVEGEDSSPHRKGSPGLQHLALEVPDRATVDAVHEAAVAGGWDVVFPPQLYPGYAEGYYAVFVEDPDGSRWEVAHIPNPA
jgi:catechol 2,3-dioxygenase-like lactoylglutathione lyase family enzyme